jgi:hypothetical protein
MDERERAFSIVEVAQRGDMALLKSFAYDMILNAKSEERERILKIVEEEAGQYSYKEEMVRPSIVAAVFLNSVRAKVKPDGYPAPKGEMELPTPEDVKDLMTAMSVRVEGIVVGLILLATAYGVHGRSLTYGEFSFQVTRIQEKWSVYIFSSGGPKDLLGARIDEKLLFLEHSKEFKKDYEERIVSLYQQLRKISPKG